MPTVKPSIVITLRKICWLMPALLLAGCSLSPSIPLIGAYYPGWLFCIIAGVIFTLITRRAVLRFFDAPAFSGVIYTALLAIYSMLFWLVFFNSL
ncbi:YtcA family lipoprotein [Pseudocitrobacter cyperus]|uniref:Uncharacterized protein YtcA n=1 Tax=Pseudocitrobacter cyperus TaxID=3112843 RepID=A0ABV0HNX0_9ENTR